MIDTPRPRGLFKTGHAFVAPAVLLMVLILMVPVVVAAILSFSNYSLGSPDFDWVGVKNYSKLFARSTYKKMLTASFVYIGVVVPLSVSLGLGAALLINSLGRFGNIYKTIYFLPVMATLLVMAIVWEFILHPDVGVVNRLLALGCGTFAETILSFGWLPWVDPATTFYGHGCAQDFPHWLGSKHTALGTIIFIGVWQGFGFNMVLYLAGLTSVPRELVHASVIDGADSAWDRFWLVTWPMLGPTTVFVVVITTIRSFQVFDTVEALTDGGPVKTTYVMMYAIYEKGILQNLIGIGSAITIVFLLFVLAVTLVQRWFVERRVHYT